MSRQTQNSRILAYIEDFGSINPLQALSDLGVMRLASRISDLKRMGYPIRKDMEAGINRYGERVRYAKYSMIKEDK